MSFTDQQLLQIGIAVKAAMFEASAGTNARLDQAAREIAAVHTQLDNGDQRMTRIERDLAQNTSSTEEMREMFDTAKKGLKVMGSLGNGLKWLVSVAAAVGTAWALWRGHKP